MGKVCHFWGQQWHSEVKSKFTTTSMWQISPWKSFSKIVSVFPLVPFCQTHFFFTIFQGWKVFMGSELRNATSDANRASTTFLQQPNGSESWDFRQLKKNFEFFIEIKLSFRCTLHNNQIDIGRFLGSFFPAILYTVRKRKWKCQILILFQTFTHFYLLSPSKWFFFKIQGICFH